MNTVENMSSKRVNLKRINRDKTFDKLPNDVRHITATFLNAKEVICMYRTCKAFHQIRFVATVINQPAFDPDQARQNVVAFFNHVRSLVFSPAGIRDLFSEDKAGARAPCKVASYMLSLMQLPAVPIDTIIAIAKYMLRGFPLCARPNPYIPDIQAVLARTLASEALVPVRELMIQCGADLEHPVKVEDREEEFTILTLAVLAKKCEAVRFFLQKGASIDGLNNTNGLTPLHLAEDLQVCQLLVNWGADPNSGQSLSAPKKEVEISETPLMICIDLDKPDCMLALLTANADPNLGNELTNPLILATRSGNANFVAQLLQYKADVNAQPEKFKITALSEAAHANINSDVFELLLQANPDLKLRDVHGNTTMHYAVKTGLFNAYDLAVDGYDLIEILRSPLNPFAHMLALAARNADFKMRNFNGKDPIEYAKDSVSKYLKEKGYGAKAEPILATALAAVKEALKLYIGDKDAMEE